MPNSLIKDTTIVSTVGIEEVPAIPYRPATPARTVYETRQVCSFRYAGPGHYEFTTDPSTGQTRAVWIPDSLGGNTGGLESQWICDMVNVPVVIPGQPAQPYVPGYTRTTTALSTGYNLGWNAGGRSIDIFTNDGWIEFKVRASVVGVICGINFYDGIDSGYNGNTIDYAFYCARGRAWIIRNGIMGASVGAYTDATVFRVERAGTDLTMSMDGSEVASFTSGVPTDGGWLEASLYAGTDEVFDPVITQVGSPDTSDQSGDIEASMEAMVFFATEGTYSEIVASLPHLALAGESGLATPAYAVGNFALPAIGVEAASLTGEIGEIGLTFEALDMLAADHPYGEMFATLSPLTMQSNALEGNLNASIGGLAQMTTAMSGGNYLVVTMNSTGTISSVFLITSQVLAEMRSEATLGSTLSVQSLLHVIMNSVATGGWNLGTPDAESETWVINVDEGGSTTYTGYNFNSYAFSGGKYYAAGAEGIVELTGNTDDGDPIRAYMHFGQRDFGTRTKKTVYNAYVGTSASGNLFVKLLAEGQSYIYKVRDYNPKLQQQRFTFGKGLRTNYVEMELFNENGADFELDSVEFIVADLTRKI